MSEDMTDTTDGPPPLDVADKPRETDRLFDGMDEPRSIQFQLDEWVKGNPLHNPVRQECCPDFSCCEPEFLAPEATRQVFVAADDDMRMQMLGGFLHSAFEKAFGEKDVYVAGADTVPGDDSEIN